MLKWILIGGGSVLLGALAFAVWFGSQRLD